MCGGAEPAAALPSPGLSAAGPAAVPRAPQRIINRASQGPGQRRPFTPPLLPPGILLFLKTAASWAAEKRQLCGRRSCPAAEETGSSVSAPRAGGIRAAGSPGWAGGPGSFLKAARLLRKPRDFHGALEKSAMEMVMGALRLVLRKGKGGAFRPARPWHCSRVGGAGGWPGGKARVSPPVPGPPGYQEKSVKE